MRRSLSCFTLAAAMVGVASPAVADSLGGLAGNESSEETTETQFRREGFAIGVGAGPALVLGRGQQEYARGGGASLSMRLGTSAGENLLWFVQLDIAGHGQQSGASLLGIGAHYYVRETMWVRGGLSLASAVQSEADGGKATEGGLALVAGVGADVFRRGIFAFDLEMGLSRAGYKDGTLTMALLQGVANWY